MARPLEYLAATEARRSRDPGALESLFVGGTRETRHAIYSLGVREQQRSRIIPAALLLEAYCTGIFPMAMEDGEIAWFSPDPRGIIPLEAFHVPHGLRRRLKRECFQIRLNTAFEKVIRACSERTETWISE